MNENPASAPLIPPHADGSDVKEEGEDIQSHGIAVDRSGQRSFISEVSYGFSMAFFLCFFVHA